MSHDWLMSEMTTALEEAGWNRVSGPASGPMTGYRKTFDAGMAQMTLRCDGSEEIELHRITTIPTGRGVGDEAMSSLIATADHIGTPLCLRVLPFKGGMSEVSLRCWYRKHGFESDPSASYHNAMRREPMEPAEPEQRIEMA